MNFDEFKEKVINYGYGFMEVNDGLMATVKSGVFDTDFYVFINSAERFIKDFKDIKEDFGKLEKLAGSVLFL